MTPSYKSIGDAKTTAKVECSPRHTYATYNPLGEIDTNSTGEEKGVEKERRESQESRYDEERERKQRESNRFCC